MQAKPYDCWQNRLQVIYRVYVNFIMFLNMDISWSHIWITSVYVLYICYIGHYFENKFIFD